jgi:hypothetical protein
LPISRSLHFHTTIVKQADTPTICLEPLPKASFLQL